jgi:signal transduction histidine kinase
MASLPNGCSTPLVVEPFFYQTAWFIGLVALSLTLGAWSGIRARTRRLQVKSRELERLVAQRTAELRASNQEIQRQLKVLDEQAHEIASTNKDLEKRNAQLEELDKEKNEILGIVAHDLKNPISAVRGLADLIQTGFVEGEQTQEIAAQIAQTSDRMLELVKNLLDVSRLEQGAMEFHVVAFNVAPFVENSVWQYMAAAEAKDIRLRFESEESFGEPMILADEQALMQILDNLISNAVKYSPRGKSVTARVKALAESVRIEVQDEGPGITPEEMPLLFGKFARLSARPTGGEHSTGLGLSIVKKLVEAMNGRVWCESEPNKGARFIVEFPRHAANSKELSPREKGV